MYTIIPLAGPDFYSTAYGIKPLHSIDGTPLIPRALQSRCWNDSEYLASTKIIFVLKQSEQLKDFQIFINENFPASKTVVLSDFTKGALCSAMAGASLISDFEQPIVVDLVDIIYEANFNPQELFAKTDLAGILPWFESNDPAFSYLEIKDQRVVRTVEKQVISQYASAGTYFFRNLSVFSNSFLKSIENFEKVAFKGNLFLCPAFSYMNANVAAIKVKNAEPLSKQFK